MAKKTIRDLTDLRNKRALIRVDFNVPLDDQGQISNDRRIRAALPTIQCVLDGGASAIVMSHLGRPKGDPKKDAIYRMDQVAHRLGELIKKMADAAIATGEMKGQVRSHQCPAQPWSFADRGVDIGNAGHPARHQMHRLAPQRRL